MRNCISPANTTHLLVALSWAVTLVSPACGQEIIHEDLKIIPSDAADGDQFGYSISINNGIVAIGSIGDDDQGLFSGSVYLFDAFSGNQIMKILPNDGAEFDFFGMSIALDNDIVAIGAPLDDDNGNLSGSAYLFDVNTGVQLAKLHPDDAAARDWFGSAIAISNDVVVVGAYENDDVPVRSDSVYVFDASTGVQVAKLIPNGGANLDTMGFGFSVSIDNNIVAAGATLEDGIDFQTGAAHIFDATTGVELAKLMANDGEFQDLFGFSIAISNGIVAVGAPQDTENGILSGSAYLFDANTGEQLHKLIPNDGIKFQQFGFSIAIENGLAVVGAWDNDLGVNSGSVYVFDVNTGLQIAKLLASDGTFNDRLGTSLAINNGIVAAGAYFDAPNHVQSGSAYVFNVNINCPADLTNDGSLDFFDISAFLSAFAAMSPAADFTADGSWNFFDVSAFLTAFSQGCP